MCRNIRVLHNFAPPTTPEEIRAAALQYVRKVSGVARTSSANAAAFDRAVDDVAAATAALLAFLPERTPQRTREGERERAKRRGIARVRRAGPV